MAYRKAPMHWLFLLLALAIFWGALVSKSAWMMVLCMLASLGLFFAWARGLYLAKIGSRENKEIIDPLELHKLKEQAKALKAAKAIDIESGNPPNPPRGMQ